MSKKNAAKGGEFDFIRWIRDEGKMGPRVEIGPGDDCAAVTLDPSCLCLLTTDMLLEGTHFDLSAASPYEVGRKAMNCSISDIAAMGGEAIAALVAVALAPSRGRSFSEELYKGLEAATHEFDIDLVGGDVTSWDHPVAICVSMLGHKNGPEPIPRSGAQVGDAIMVTGSLGGAILSKHLSFVPRLREAQTLNKNFKIHSMIDISDGLSADLNHIMEESNVGAVLQHTSIPISEDATTCSEKSGKNAIEHALSDGEDYELLFTLAQEEADKVIDSELFEIPITKIGCITQEPGMYLESQNGQRTKIEPSGWEHLA